MQKTNYSLDEYKNKALHLANNKQELKNIRNKIIKNRFSTSLFNTEEFTRNLEDEYQKLFFNFKQSR